MMFDSIEQTADQELTLEAFPWNSRQILYGLIIATGCFIGFYSLSRYNFLLFHVIAEFFSIAVAWALFLLVWNARRFIETDWLVFLGAAYFFIGGIDLVHVSTHEGMRIFGDRWLAANLATQLDIAARFMESLTLLAAPLFFKRRANPLLYLGGFALLTCLIFLSIFYWETFPACYIKGIGLTPFKKNVEYAICVILLAAIPLLNKWRKRIDDDVFYLLLAAIIMTIVSETFFTLYVGSHVMFLLIAHYFKILSYVLIYLALVRSGLTRPYDVLFRELTLQKESLYESEHQLRTLINAMPDIVCFKDTRGRWLAINDYGRNLFQLDGIPYQGKTDYQLAMAAPASRDILLAFEKEKEKAWLAKKITRKDEVITAPGDTPKVFDVIRIPTFQSDGRPRGMIVVGRDVTERKQTETAISQAHSKLKAIYESLPGFINVIDREFNIVEMAKGWAGTFDIEDIDACIGRKCYAVFQRRTEVCPWCDVPEVFESRRTKARFSTPVEEKRTGLQYKLFSSPMISASGEVIGAVEYLLDITDLKRMEDALRYAKETAESASRSKGEFLANTSHEIRTPLNGVLGMLQVLATTRLDDQQRKFLDMAEGAARTLLLVINDILDLSRIEAGKLELTAEKFWLHELIRSTTGTFLRPAREKGVILHHHIAADTPSMLVGDSGRLRQILFNLVGNAVKYTEAGEVGIEVYSIQPEYPDRITVHFAVTDTGIGIPEDKLENIFDPFVQVDGSITRKHKGTGLGLGIVRRLVDLMDGGISVESKEGFGTRVQFHVHMHLPDGQQEKPEVPDDCTEEIPKPAPVSDIPPRILVVEDDELNQEVFTYFLSQINCQVTCVPSGLKALKRLDCEIFDCILMDIQLPEMDGMTVTRHIRNSEKAYCNIPIIALTAHAMKGDREEFLSAGMDAYIAKPVDKAELTRTLKRFIRAS